MLKPSDKIHHFTADKVVGDEGERIIENYLKSLPHVHRVVNMANNELFFKKDVDFVICLTNGKKLRIEVKTDQYTSGNIYYETVSNDQYDVEGCMEKTECDMLFYYFINLDTLYILDMKTYKETMKELIETNHPAICQKFVKNQKEGYVSKSVGYTLPLAVLEELMPGKTLQIVKGLKK